MLPLCGSYTGTMVSHALRLLRATAAAMSPSGIRRKLAEEKTAKASATFLHCTWPTHQTAPVNKKTATAADYRIWTDPAQAPATVAEQHEALRRAKALLILGNQSRWQKRKVGHHPRGDHPWHHDVLWATARNPSVAANSISYIAPVSIIGVL